MIKTDILPTFRLFSTQTCTYIVQMYAPLTLLNLYVISLHPSSTLDMKEETTVAVLVTL